MIWKRELEGEVLVQFEYANSYLEGHSVERDKVDNGCRPDIWIPPILKKYFPEKITEEPVYDEVQEEYVNNAYLTLIHTNEALEIIRYIEMNNGKIYKSPAKKAKCVIEFLVTVYDKYLMYREKGYKIYYYLDVLEFFKCK